MSKNDVVDTLLDLSGQRNVITVYRAFVDFTGDLAAAMMLSQLLYWTPRSPDPDGWIAKSDVAFAEELCLTTYGVRKGRKILEEMGFLHTEVKRFAGAPTLRYRIDQEFLFRKWTLRKRKMDFAKTQDGLCENAGSCSTEITTENTTEKKPRVSPISEPHETEESLKSKVLAQGLTNEDFKAMLKKEAPVEKAPRSVLDEREPNWADPVQAGGSDELAEILIEGICQFNVPGCGLDSLPDKQREGWLRRASEIIQDMGGGTADQVALAWRCWKIQYDWRSSVNPFARSFGTEFGIYLIGVRKGKITKANLDLKERDLMKPIDGDAVQADRTPAPAGGIRVNVGTFDNPVWKDLGDVT